MVLAGGRPAWAQEGIAVSWSAPRECPASAELQSRVIARAPSDAVVRARGRVERAGKRWRASLEIETTSARGERVIDAETCDALASSAAVVIAMAVAPPRAPDEPASTSAPPPPEPPPATAPVAAPPTAERERRESAAPERDRDPARERSEDATREGRVLVRVQGAVDVGLLPSAAIGGGFAVGVSPVDRLVVEIAGDFWGAQDGHVDATRGATFHLLSAGARACWAITRTAEISPCVGAEILRLSASGFGASKIGDADAIAWAPELAATGRVPLAGPLSVRVGLGAIAPMSRQSFVITSAGTVHRPGAVAARGWLGPEVRF
jgi:hypothetical protein